MFCFLDVDLTSHSKAKIMWGLQAVHYMRYYLVVIQCIYYRCILFTFEWYCLCLCVRLRVCEIT